MSFSAQNKAEFYVFSNPHWSSLLWSCSRFLRIQKNFHHLSPSSVSSHLQRTPVCQAYGLWSTDFKSKIKACPQSMGHIHVSTNSALQFLSVSNRDIRLSSTLCPRSGILRKYWHHVCHLSISPQAQRWLKAGGDKLQLATLTITALHRGAQGAVIVILFTPTTLFST